MDSAGEIWATLRTWLRLCPLHAQLTPRNSWDLSSVLICFISLTSNKYLTGWELLRFISEWLRNILGGRNHAPWSWKPTSSLPCFPHTYFSHVDFSQYFHCLIHQVTWFIGSELRVKQRPLPPFKAGMAHTHMPTPEVFTWVRFWRPSPARLCSHAPVISVKKHEEQL